MLRISLEKCVMNDIYKDQVDWLKIVRGIAFTDLKNADLKKIRLIFFSLNSPRLHTSCFTYDIDSYPIKYDINLYKEYFKLQKNISKFGTG